MIMLKFFKKKRYFILAAVAFVLFVGIASACYILFTRSGSGFITRFVLSKYIGSENISVETVDGNLAKGLTLSNIKVRNVEILPRGSALDISKLYISFALFNQKGLSADIDNSKLKMPGSDTIIFYGDYLNSSLNVNIYTNHLNIQETLNLFIDQADLRKISGYINDLDIYIKGSFSDPEISGKFKIEKFSRNKFSISNCPGTLAVKLKNIGENLKLYGEVIFEKGEISGKKTAVIKLQESRIFFSEDFREPAFNIKGKSVVEGVKIDIGLKGTIDKYDLSLSSAPYIPESELLIMLATGKKWEGAGASFEQGKVSSDLALDFIDYFVLSGSVKKMAKKLGVSSISLKVDDKTKGVGVSKEVSGSTELNYEIEQSQVDEEAPRVKQKVGVNYQITDSISIEGKKELRRDTGIDETEPSKPDDEILLKFETKF